MVLNDSNEDREKLNASLETVNKLVGRRVSKDRGQVRMTQNGTHEL